VSRRPALGIGETAWHRGASQFQEIVPGIRSSRMRIWSSTVSGRHLRSEGGRIALSARALRRYSDYLPPKARRLWPTSMIAPMARNATPSSDSV